MERIQIREGNRYAGHGIDHIGKVNCISCLVVPRLEVTDLGATDAEYDPLNLHPSHPLGHLGIEAGPALFDPGATAHRFEDDLGRLEGHLSFVCTLPHRCDTVSDD